MNDEKSTVSRPPSLTSSLGGESGFVVSVLSSTVSSTRMTSVSKDVSSSYETVVSSTASDDGRVSSFAEIHVHGNSQNHG